MSVTLPARYRFTCWETATFRRVITMLTAGPGSVPQDLTNYTAIMNIRTAPDTTPVYTLTSASGQIGLGGLGGTITLYIPASDTATFDAWEGQGLYDLAITDTGGTGDTTPLLYGPFVVRGVA